MVLDNVLDGLDIFPELSWIYSIFCYSFDICKYFSFVLPCSIFKSTLLLATLQIYKTKFTHGNYIRCLLRNRCTRKE